MPNEIELGETANIPSARYVYSEIMKEINNCGCTLREGEPEHKWRQDDWNKLLHEDRYFHGKQLAELLMDLHKNEYQFEQPRYMRTNADLFRMQLTLSFMGHVMRITDYFFH